MKNKCIAKICGCHRSFDCRKSEPRNQKDEASIIVVTHSAYQTLLSMSVLAEMAEDHCLTRREKDPIRSFVELICRLNADNLTVQLMKQGYIKETEMS